MSRGRAPVEPRMSAGRHALVMDGPDPGCAIDPGDADRRARGERAERFVADRLREAGWHIVGRRVVVGRDELDLVAVEPDRGGAGARLVFVEVRSARDGRFGAPEESVVGRKARRTYRAALALLRAGALPDGRVLPRLPWRVDVVAVTGRVDPDGDAAARVHPMPRVRHIRGVDPG